MPLKLFKRDGCWHYRGTIAGDRLRGSTRTANKEIAAQIAAKIEAEHWQHHINGPQKAALTFPQAVAIYLAAGKGQSKRERLYLERIVRYWGDRKVKEITAGAIKQSAIDIHPHDGGATRNRQVVTPTKAIINLCAERDLCSPIRVRGFKVDKKIKPPITLEWIDAFCAHARPIIKALALDMYSTGRRISEAMRAEWPDYDFKARTVLVRDTKTGTERLAHMPDRLLVALANLPRDDRPFPWSESSLRRFWDEDVAKTAKAVPGFQRLTFHSARHGFATALLRYGVDVVTVSKLGGWSSPHLVLTTYAHAINNPRLTDRLFDTPVTRGEPGSKKINGLDE
jgi:integrase